MGLASWFSKKIVTGMVHAACISYRELKSKTNLSEADVCQEVVRRRLLGGVASGLLMDNARRMTLELMLPSVQNIEDACCAILTLETTTRNNCPVSFEEFHEMIRGILAKKGLLPEGNLESPSSP
jgi:hypothetical protein